ncbi:MAG: GTPase [Clostridia bacterium]|nr:GTPase [Clostridia bacterium]
MNNIPVYLFTGFLEAGKTKFIRDTMEDENFNAGERTLILLCEEGEEELDLSRCPDKGASVTVFAVPDQAWFTEDRLEAQRKRAKAERVLVEYNGLWQLDSFYNHMPPNWGVAQEIFLADATTILTYNANMRQQTVDKLSSTEVVIFNRVTPAADRMALHKLVRGVSRRARIAYEDTDGNLDFDTIEDPLPFDINADPIVIEDRDFALWYRDISEETEKYDQKTVSFLGVVAKNGKMPKNSFAIGRHVMTCCEADIAYRAFLAEWPQAAGLSSYDWVRVTAKIEIKRSSFYGGPGPVLSILSLSPAERPEPEVATFY